MNDLLYTQRLHGRLRWFHFNSGERKLPSENLTAAEQFCKVKKGALLPCSLSKQVRFSPAAHGRAKISSRATQKSCCGRCLGIPPAPSAAGYEADQKPRFFYVLFLFLNLIEKLHFALIPITYLLRDRASCRWGKSGAPWSPFPQLKTRRSPARFYRTAACSDKGRGRWPLKISARSRR